MKDASYYYAQACLVEWGNWYRAGDYINLGCPKKAAFYDGGSGSPSTASGEEEPLIVQEIDPIFCKMPEKIQKAVRQRFVKNRGDKIEANECDCSIPTYRRRFERGIWIVAREQNAEI